MATFSHLSIPAWACGKVASDLGLGGGFRRVLRFTQLLASHELAIIGINVTKNEIPNPKFQINHLSDARLENLTKCLEGKWRH